MTYDTYRIIFHITGGMGIAFLIIAVFLFWKFKIHKIIGDLNGRNAQKAIKGIHEQNINGTGTGVKLSGKVTKLSLSPEGVAITEKIMTQKMETTVLSAETVILNEGFSILEDITFVQSDALIS